MSGNSALPKHIGLILDGNRRWAKANGRPTLEGHRKGAEVFKNISLKAFDKGVRYVSAYIFSNENWSRTEEEVGYLMGLIIKAVENYLQDFHKGGIKIMVIGRRDALAKDVLASIERTEALTKDNGQGTLALCLNYGGREEIVDAVNQLDKPVTVEAITGALYAPEMPDLDLVVRTSGEQRLSGFMLWRTAYAEFLFTETLWPDFTEADLDKALAEYAARQRRFGS